jgi:hypothetical protein
VIAFITAVVVTTAWGSIVQTQYNLSALNGINAGIGGGVWMATTFRDLFSGFSPTYAGYIVLPSLLVAFVAASWVAKQMALPRSVVLGAAGGVAIAVGIPLVNYLAPVALLVGATRDTSCIVLMAFGGVIGGVIFSLLSSYTLRYEVRDSAASTS